MESRDAQTTDEDPVVPPTTEGPGSFGASDPDERVGQGEEGGRAHTKPGEGHPAGDGERSGRDVGGPTSAEGEEGATGTPGGRGRIRGDISTKGFEPHE